MEVIAKDISNERTVVGIVRVVLSQEEIEVIIGSPKVESFRELENERREIGLFESIAIGAYWKWNEKSKHCDLDEVGRI